MNAIIFQTINNFANTSKLLDFVGIFFAEYLLYIIGIAFVVILLIKRTRLMAISIAVSVFLARIVIAEPIKRIFNVTRPNGEPFSFPSGHATIVFAIAMAIYFFNKKWGIVTFIIAILVGISRIFVGIHWPIDILGGAVIGILSGIIVYKFIIKKKNNS